MKIPICEGKVRVTITKKHKSYLRKGFYLGVIFALSVFSLITDIMGKEGCIKHIQENWSTIIITGPIAAVIVIIWCLITLIVGMKKGE